jgi:Peptidase M60, enhancin and enhancin-like/N-terminal domain of M60-like peptidases
MMNNLMRTIWAVLIFLAAGSGHAAAPAGLSDARVLDRAPLIEGVRSIAAPGAPGSLVVFASTSSAIVTGKSGGGSAVPVVASGHLGRGRIVAFAHDGYFTKENFKIGDTGKLLLNAVHWAAAGKPTPRTGLIELPELQSLLEAQHMHAVPTTLDANMREYDVLVLTPYRVTPEQAKGVRSFVEAGGGLIAAATGWGWQQGSKKPMAEFPGNLLVAGSGLAWTDGYAGTTLPEGYAAGGEISPFVNAERARELIAAGREIGAKDLACALESIRLTLHTVPANEGRFHADINKVLHGLQRLDLVPSRRKPVGLKDPMRRFAVGLETAIALDAAPAEVRALAAATHFPGEVSTKSPRGVHTVTVDTAIPGWHSLGLYASAGEKISLSATKTSLPLKLVVQIGCHTDALWHLDSWERIPEMVRRFPINELQTTAASALGGLIYIDVADGTRSQKIEVSVKGAVEAPFYQLGVTTIDDWKSRNRRRSAPWAELASRNVIFTVPSALVRDFDDPAPVLKLWDRIVAAQDSFVSRPRRERPERIVADAQISAGYMHSGYPIMIPIDDSIKTGLNEQRLRREGAWGLFHELGHNHQSDAWTFDGTGEVTNNLIVLYVFDKVLGLRFDSGHEAIRDRTERAKRIRAFMGKGAPFPEWKDDPFLALMMYIQLYEAFGSKPFETVFAEYARLPAAEKPKSDDEKRDQWLVRLSKAAGKNLGPFFQAWGVPTSERARASIENLPGWMPAGG